MSGTSPARAAGVAPPAPVPVPRPRDPLPAEEDPRAGAPEPVAAPASCVREPDLLTLRLNHRLARRDTRRLAAVADGLASGTTRFDEKRALAFGDWVERVCEECAHHHDAEDAALRPLLERHAGSAVDLTDLAGDHVALHALLDGVRRRSRAVVAALVLRPTAVATARDFAGMRELASALAELTELVEEHLTETERVTMPALVAHVPRDAWAPVRDELRAATPEPRLRAVADADELAGLRAAHGRLREAGMRVATARVRRRENLVYGVDDAEGEGADA